MNQLEMLLFKVAVLLPFVFIGTFFKQYFKRYIDEVPFILLIFTSVLINIVLKYAKGESLGSAIIHLSNFPENPIVFFLVAVNGIVAWYRICGFISSKVVMPKIIKQIASNTYAILLGHQLMIFLTQIVLFVIFKDNLFKGLSISYLLENEWNVFVPVLQYGILEEFRVLLIPPALMIPVLISNFLNFTRTYFLKKGGIAIYGMQKNRNVN